MGRFIVERMGLVGLLSFLQISYNDTIVDEWSETSFNKMETESFWRE